ncbi:NUDIX hydrolase [Synergistaceae bacterium OttesenSCG-928-I11]|nr:NUDIX hydrolase [Synergistaceae bacterium OttesenSCG-928-I11]
MDLIETCVGSERLYEGRILNLRRDSVKLPDGRIRQREVVEHDPAVVIVAENDNGELLLIEQFRYPIAEAILEFPAGIVERGEDYEEAAVRELQEETGWKPGSLELVAEVFASPGFTTELFVIFYATALTQNKLPEDDDEFIVPRFYTRAEVERLLKEGAIVDGKTLLGIYWWLRKKDTR